MDGNPIRRRGVVVAIGSATCHNQNSNDHPTGSYHPSNRTEAKSGQALNNYSIVSSEKYSPHIRVHPGGRCRIRDRNSVFSRPSSNRKRSVNPMDDSYHQYSQCVTSNMSHKTPANPHTNQPYFSQPDTKLTDSYNAIGSNYYVGPSQFGRSDLLTVAPKSFHEKHLSNQCTPDESEHQAICRSILNGNLGNNLSLSANDSFQRGIHRFQRRKEERPDLPMEGEGNFIDFFDKRLDSSWGTISGAGFDLSSESKDRQQYFSERNGTLQQRHKPQHGSEYREYTDRIHWNHPEKENSYEDLHLKTTANQQQSIEVFAEIASNHILYDITGGLNSTREFTSPPSSAGINRFKYRGQPKINSDQPFQMQHSQSEQTIFGHSTMSDGVDSVSGYPENSDEYGYQLESSTQSIRFFDDQNEIDISGNSLTASMPRLPDRERGLARFRTQRFENRVENIGVTPSTAGLSRNEHFDDIGW